MPTCRMLKVILISKCFRDQLSHICCKIQYKSRHLQNQGNHSTSYNTIKAICAKHILPSSSHYKHSLFNTPLYQNHFFNAYLYSLNWKYWENHMREASDLHKTLLFTVLIFKHRWTCFVDFYLLRSRQDKTSVGPLIPSTDKITVSS